MKNYKIKEEFWSKWGSCVDENTVVTEHQIEFAARIWDVEIDTLMEQVELEN